MSRFYNRIIAILLLTGIIFSMSPSFEFGVAEAAADKPEAQNIQVSGTLKPGYTLSTVYDYVYTNQEGASEYKWLDCNTVSGTYAEIAGATGKSYTLKNAQQTKYIKFQVTPVSQNGTRGDIVQTPAIGPIAAALGPVGLMSSAYSDANELTPPEYKFNILGSNNIFSLLDTTDDNNSKFFVMGVYITGSPNARYSSTVFDLDNLARFDPNNNRNIGYYLNNVLTDTTTNQAKWSGVSGGTDNRLPPQLAPYIDRNHEWVTEGGEPNVIISNCPNDYITVCGVNLLSMKEYEQYHSKIGFADGIIAGNWWLRTSLGIGNGGSTNRIIVVQFASATKGTTAYKNSFVSSGQGVVRPVFYLKKNFITSLKLDVNSMGAEVKKAIIKNYHISELQGLYTNQELITIGYANLPQAQNVGIKGSKAANEMLSGEYAYSSPNSKAETNSTFRWLYCSTENGTYAPIPGAVSKTYTIDPAYIGKYIKFEVTPINVDGLGGEIVPSSSFGPIRQTQDVSVVMNQFTDKNGGIFTNLQTTPSIGVNMNITNRTSSDKQAFVMFAIYDAHNTLLKAELKPLLVQAGTNSYNTSMDLNGQGYILRTVVLDGLDSMRPLSLVKETR